MASEPCACLIFVFAGRESRKRHALQLFYQGLSTSILLSVGRFEIRRFSNLPLPAPVDLLKLAQDIAPAQRHFFVHFESRSVQVEHVLPGRFGTLTEVEALARWLRNRPEIQCVAIVSSKMHLYRIRMCCRSLLPTRTKITLISAPEGSAGISRPESPASILTETLKIPLYWLILKLSWLRRRLETHP